MKQKKNNLSNNLAILLLLILTILFTTTKLTPTYYYFIGKNFYEKQNYVKAYQNLKKAYNTNKENKEYRYYYTKTLTNLSPTINIQKEIFDLSVSSQKDSAQQAAEKTVSNWRNQVLSYIGDNYIEQAPLDKGIIRWDENKFPLKIIVVNNSGIEIPQYYNTEIMKSFAQWQASTGFIKFATTNTINNANIIVNIIQPPSNLCSENNCKYIVGYTTPNYKKSLLNNMTIVLYATDPLGNFFSDKELYNVILHEIGHALGIMGHSYSSEDLMYMDASNNNNFYAPYRSSFQYLSSKDINTIKLLYKLVPNITNTPIKDLNTKGLIYSPIILGTSSQISQRKLKEAQNYVKNAPNISSGYIDMGIAYAELNKNKQAIKAMQKAYELAKTDNEKYIVLYNLSAIYLNTNKYDTALDYANQAKNINNNEDINELILNINLQKNKKQDKKLK